MKRLAGEGVSIRQIAKDVFRDARLRGRVERILATNAESSVAPAAPVSMDTTLEGVDVSNVSTPDLVRLLVRRRLEAAAVSGEVPSCAELRNLLDLQRRLDAFEQVERAKARARAARSSG
ncbi:MAG: hypothetical protein ABSC51_11440 [Gaiellaceae bacterium]